MTRQESPLLLKTPDDWGDMALQDIISLLNDHAHLEKKAAGNALDLLHCWPRLSPPPQWIRTLCAIAVDEVQHLAIVARILESRGASMSRGHRNQYAQDLRGLVRKGTGPDETVDRLLVSAAIEARSCERFEILSRLAPRGELAKLYKGLWASEHGHYRAFVELASMVQSTSEVRRRWRAILCSEAEIIVSQKEGSRIHSWTG